MKEVAAYIGTILFYVVVALGALAISLILVAIILLAAQGVLYQLKSLTPMLGVY
jgi:hypothetical protein